MKRLVPGLEEQGLLCYFVISLSSIIFLVSIITGIVMLIIHVPYFLLLYNLLLCITTSWCFWYWSKDRHLYEEEIPDKPNPNIRYPSESDSDELKNIISELKKKGIKEFDYAPADFKGEIPLHYIIEGRNNAK